MGLSGSRFALRLSESSLPNSFLIFCLRMLCSCLLVAISVYLRAAEERVEGRGVSERAEAKDLAGTVSMISESGTRLMGSRMSSPFRLSSSFSSFSRSLKLSRR